MGGVRWEGSGGRGQVGGVRGEGSCGWGSGGQGQVGGIRWVGVRWLGVSQVGVMWAGSSGWGSGGWESHGQRSHRWGSHGLGWVGVMWVGGQVAGVSPFSQSQCVWSHCTCKNFEPQICGLSVGQPAAGHPTHRRPQKFRSVSVRSSICRTGEVFLYATCVK